MSEERLYNLSLKDYTLEVWKGKLGYPLNQKDIEELEHIIDYYEQENQQLKRNCNIGNENLNFYREEYKKYKSVLNEIREYINNYDVFKEFSFPLMKRDEENQVKSSIDYEFQTSIKKSLLQILDKVKDGC